MSYMATGAVPGGFKRPAGIAPLRKMAPGAFRSGPQIMVGPFVFADDGREHAFTASQAWFGSRAGMSTQTWIAEKLSIIAGKYKKLCGASSFSMLGQTLRCQRGHKTWSINEMLPWRVWRGQFPVARTKHPKTGEEWGLYIHFDTNTLRVRWKKVPKSLFAKIWDAIVSVVSFIVETLKDMFDVLRSMACALAKSKLNEVAAISQKKKQMDSQMEQALAIWGVQKGDISKLRESEKTGVIDRDTATNIGNAIIAGVCNEPPPIAKSVGIPWVLWGIVGVVGVVGILALVKRKPK